jgi:ER lumen protein retaining receptor
MYTFSLILESVCVLPQLLLLRQTTVPTVIDSFYLLTLGSYRAFYLANWIVRGATEHYFEPISAIFGIIQTAFYVDFAWVYWTRQRVKLRSGGVVDSEDLRKGWLVNRVLGAGRRSTEVDEEDGYASVENSAAAANGQARVPTRWGARGVSISADDTLEEYQPNDKGKSRSSGQGAQREQEPILEGEEDLLTDDEEDALPIPDPREPVLNSGQEWGNGRADSGVGRKF